MLVLLSQKIFKKMRILSKEIDGKDASGRIKLCAEESEDMYHLYNILAEGDSVRCSTVRNVTRESSTGTTSKSRVKLTITIAVESVEFDVDKSSLRCSGRNVEENAHVRMGQYHTIDIEVSQPFWIDKPCWDDMYLHRLDQATNPANNSDIAAVVMHEGLAHVCLLTSCMTVTRSRIERRMPRKKVGESAYNKARLKFFDEVYEAIKEHINFSLIKVVLLGSPAFLKDDFMNHYSENAVRKGDTVLIQNKGKFLKGRCSSGHKKSVEELLADANQKGFLNDVKAADEVKALENFYVTLAQDPDRACYGFSSVCAANALVAVNNLLVTDKLFKSKDYAQRRAYLDMVDSVKEHGGGVFIFSSLHVTGEQLDKFTGVAATLRFPCPDLETSEHVSGARGVVDSDSDSDSDSDDDHIFVGVSKETAKAMKETQKLQTQMKEMGL